MGLKAMASIQSAKIKTSQATAFLMVVASVKCGDYSQDNVDYAVKRVMSLLNFNPGRIKEKTVLLKVNCLMAAPPEKHITTHPSVVSALCRYFLENEAKKVQIGESSGVGTQGRTERALRECGMAQVAGKWGAELVDFDRHKIVTIEKPYLKLGIAEPALKADLLVSVPKLKTHTFTKYTGAVKNMFGCLPGAAKANVHRVAGGEPRFSEMLVDVYSILKPKLAVMDAVWGMEGNGPTNGPLRKIGAILASENPVELDLAAARMVGFEPMEINTNRIAFERGLVSSKKAKIVGDVFNVQGFRKPDTTRSAAVNFLQGIFYNLTRLEPVSNEKCIGCATCAKGCPVGAIEMVAGRPKFDRKKCIYCYCCHELCPHSAMDLRRSPKILPNKLRRLLRI